MESPLRNPPSGVVSNFSAPQFLGLPVLVAAGIVLPLVLLFAGVRIFATTSSNKRWKLDDCLYLLTCVLGVAFIAFSISIAIPGASGYHAWDIDVGIMPRSSIIGLFGFWIALGPMLWLIKLTFFSLLFRTFGSVRWLKNIAWAGIVITGLFFSTYTIVVTMTCGPRGDSDAQTYVDSLNRHECSGSGGVNAVTSIVTSVLNCICNVIVVTLSATMLPTLYLPTKQLYGAYAFHVLGAMICVCSFAAAVFRVTSWQSTDVTGSQIPFYSSTILEIGLSLIIVCLPATWSLYRRYAFPDIDDRTTIATPSMKLLSSVASPEPESKNTWRKTHQDIDEIPYRQASRKYNRHKHDHRMKALPATPLPLSHTAPPSPSTPASFRSMSLPIMFQRPEIPRTLT